MGTAPRVQSRNLSVDCNSCTTQMPFFEKRKKRTGNNGASNSPPPEPLPPPPPMSPQRNSELSPTSQAAAATARHRELVFHAQLAHGSPTKKIMDFSNVKELYQRIAEAFGMSSSEVCYLGK